MKKTLLSFACLSVLSINQQLEAQPSFNPAANFATGSYPFSISSGDFNGDGFPDIATANYSSDDVSVFIGNGSGGFSPAAAYAVGASPDAITVSDVNADGINDMIVTNSNSNDVSVLLGNGSGGFSTAVNYATGAGPQSCVTGDFDGDGKIDIAVANRNSSSISILLGDGSGAFAAQVNYGGGAAPCEIISSDFNGDGNIDLATVNNSGSTITILLGDGSGVFSIVGSYPAGSSAFSLHAADLNHDGKMDIVTANTGSNDVSVFLGDGLGAFATEVNYSTGGSTPYSVRSADFNNDGIIDLVTANNGANNVSVLLGDGSGAFTLSGNYAVGQFPVSITTSDFNKDGRQDAAVVNSFGNTISVLMNVSVGPASTLNFDGNNDYVSAPNQAGLNFGTGDFTIEANFKSSVSQGNYAGIVAKAGAGSNIGFQLVLVNDRIAAEFSNGSTGFGTGQGLQGNTVLTDGNWHHLAMVVTRSLNQIQLLVDGNVEATVINPAIATLNVNDPASLLIGVERTYGIHINGSLDEVRLWNVARTRCELISYKNCEIPTTAAGLVANYHFNEGIDMMSNPSVTTLTDASGNAIDGTLSGFALTGSASNWLSPGSVISGFSTPIACPLASALNFDGSDDYINAGTIINNVASYTKEAWIYANSGGSNNIISSASSPFWLSGNKLSVAHAWGIGFQLSDPAVFPLNVWTHVAVTYDAASSTLVLYKNGVPVATSNSAPAYVSENIQIGAYETSNFFQGNIDEVRIWSMARTQCEINTYMNSEISGPMIGLLANFHFNQGLVAYSNPGETLLSDVSGNGNNGSLNGFYLDGTMSNWVAPGGVVSGYTTTIAPPVVTVNSGAICSGQSFTMVPGGAATYTFSNGTDVAMPTSDATYTVTGTDANGCENMAVSSVTVNALPTIIVNSDAICAGQSFTMIPSGAMTFTYSNGSDVAMPTSDATYTVTGTDANGCENMAISSVTVNALPNLMAMSTSTLLCTGETATLSVMGATSYTWSTTETTMDIVVSPTTQTTYTVDGTDVNGCSNTTTLTQDVSLCTGVTALSKNDGSISLYPNPSNGILNIEFKMINDNGAVIQIEDALGQILLNESTHIQHLSFNISDFLPGVYFVKAIQNGQQHVIKIIKE